MPNCHKITAYCVPQCSTTSRTFRLWARRCLVWACMRTSSVQAQFAGAIPYECNKRLPLHEGDCAAVSLEAQEQGRDERENSTADYSRTCADSILAIRMEFLARTPTSGAECRTTHGLWWGGLLPALSNPPSC